MPPTSKSKRKKSKKLQKRNWLELPYDIMVNILHRVGVYDILENAQKVCTTWHKICKDPAMWRVIYMDSFSDRCTKRSLRKMCKHAVDRSQGQLVDLTILGFAKDKLVAYIADRSSQLRRLTVEGGYGRCYKKWAKYLKKFPLLEELGLYKTYISKEGIETAGRCCPMLQTLKVDQKAYTYREYYIVEYQMAIAIGENLPQLRHLELSGGLSRTGLRAILTGCRHLELLDVSKCFSLDGYEKM